MSRRSLNAAVSLGALAIYSCSVYSPNDLVGPDSTFGGNGGGGRAGGGGAAGFSGGAPGGTGAGGAPSGGSSGKSAGGSGASANGGSGGGTDPGGGAPPIAGAAAAGEEAGGVGGVGGSGATTGGTTTGGTTTGGVATGGSPPLAPELVEDMEDGNQNILINDDRNGAWYTAAGKGGSALPAPMTSISMATVSGTPAVAGSTRCFNFKGTGGTEWGAMVAFDFKAAATPKAVYDASNYRGISFWIKATAAVHIAVRLAIKHTTAEAGGACLGMTTGCDNHYGADVALTTSWKAVTLIWPTTTSPTLAQDPAWGFKTPFAPDELVSMQFVVLKGSSAEFSIDDIAFIP